jgi:hypothetical protein
MVLKILSNYELFGYIMNFVQEILLLDIALKIVN